MIKFAKKIYRKWLQHKRVQELQSTKQHIDKQTIISGLKSLGLTSGDIVLVHSSLKSIGFVENGPNTVVEAILEVVTEEGTVLMPSYPLKGTMYRYLQNDNVFDPVNTPSQLGAITEVFRKFPGVIRSLHPTHSIAAYGKMAEEMLKDHPKCNTPCGPGSPFSKLVEHNGKILCIGCGVGKITSYHVVEDIVSDFPYDVYLPDTLPGKYLDYQGNMHTLEMRIHCPETSKLRIDRQPIKEQQIRKLLLENDIAAEGIVGNATSELIDAKKLEHFLECNISQGITIYIDQEEESVQ